VLCGGLTVGCVFLLEGSPGTGKTTMALRFLLEGARKASLLLYVTLSETASELRATAASHGWKLDDSIELLEGGAARKPAGCRPAQSLLYSSDLELGETTKLIFQALERTRRGRVVIDSLSEISCLAQSSLRYRRQTLPMKHYFGRHRSHCAPARRPATPTLPTGPFTASPTASCGWKS
jgi:circadian clock protein KaiC